MLQVAPRSVETDTPARPAFGFGRHQVLGRAVESEVVDHCPDHDAAPHEVADGVAHVLVVPAETVHPADHERVASAQLIVEPAALGALGQPGAQTGHAVVSDHLVDVEGCCPRLGGLVLDGLLGC